MGLPRPSLYIKKGGDSQKQSFCEIYITLGEEANEKCLNPRSKALDPQNELQVVPMVSMIGHVVCTSHFV